jgi:hypothetical protein
MRVFRVAWNDEAAAALAGAMAEDSEFIANEVKSGGAVLWCCVGHGWLVTRQEGSELVFVAGAGINARDVIKLFISKKNKLKIKTCRIHSARRGMGKYLKKLGFKEVERVYKVAV